MAEAFMEAGLDYTVRERAAYYKRPDKWVEIPNVKALVRSATDDAPEAVFNVVSSRYTIIQNMDLAAALEGLALHWPIETVGALGQGERVFATLSAGLGEIAGDEMQLYFLLSDVKDGTGALSVAFTPVRVVCQNTLTSGLRQSVANLTIRHDPRVFQDLNFATQLLGQAQHSMDESMALLEALSRRQLDESTLASIPEAAYPTPNPGNWQRQLALVRDLADDDPLKMRVLDDQQRVEGHRERMDNFIHETWSLYEKFCEERPDYARTPWAMLNAVVEFEDWRDGPGNADLAVLFGSRADAKARAFEAAARLA
jgi:phage/plasmid-like protein (TIGR03299 family)